MADVAAAEALLLQGRDLDQVAKKALREAVAKGDLARAGIVLLTKIIGPTQSQLLHRATSEATAEGSSTTTALTADLWAYSCGICRDDLPVGGAVVCVNGHAMCVACSSRHLLYGKTACALCRATLFTPHVGRVAKASYATSSSTQASVDDEDIQEGDEVDHQKYTFLKFFTRKFKQKIKFHDLSSCFYVLKVDTLT